MKQIRLVLWIAVLASLVAFLDGSVINVALPAIAGEFDANFAAQQWMVDAYLITLGALMLVAGSLSDLFGRRKVMLVGLVWFGVASLLCATAPNEELLIAARALLGVGGALLVPTSLALIMTAVPANQRAKTIGRWTAWTGIAFLLGPVLGGILVDVASWRWVFAINIVPITITIVLLRHLQLDEKLDPSSRLDIVGASLAAIGLGGSVFALIEQSHLGWSHPLIYSTLTIGLLSLIGFIWHERRTSQPMMPLDLYRSRNFTVGNLATVAVYAGLSVATFIITIFVQQVGGYSATEAGLALLPITIIMFFLSSRFGALAERYGPRWFMAAGPTLGAAGFLLMLRVDASVNYGDLLPGILLFGLGLSVTVAPLTAAVLMAIDNRRSGIASAVNNAIARIAGLIAIAALGTIVGSSLGLAGFHNSILVTAALLLAGGIIAAVGISNTVD